MATGLLPWSDGSISGITVSVVPEAGGGAEQHPRSRSGSLRGIITTFQPPPDEPLPFSFFFLFYAQDIPKQPKKSVWLFFFRLYTPSIASGMLLMLVCLTSV